MTRATTSASTASRPRYKLAGNTLHYLEKLESWGAETTDRPDRDPSLKLDSLAYIPWGPGFV